MTTQIRLPRNGEPVAFHDGDKITRGICNGEAIEGEQVGVLAFLPVYVHEGDRCLYVAIPNITEWPEDES